MRERKEAKKMNNKELQQRLEKKKKQKPITNIYEHTQMKEKKTFVFD